jgi:hypothetical protein
MSSGGYGGGINQVVGSGSYMSSSALESTISECAACNRPSAPVSYAQQASNDCRGPLTYTAKSPVVFYAGGDSTSAASSLVYAGAINDPIVENKTKSNDNYYNSTKIELTFKPGQFINSSAPKTKFIKATEEVQELVEHTFLELTGRELPCFNISVCNEHELRQEHARLGGQWSPGILGFCNHRTKSIFVMENNFAELLLTIGHEIGHLLSDPLPDLVDEEAKAMAFASAWAQTIHDNNIGNLGAHIQMHQPAQNGVHNIASNFVNNMLEDGSIAMDVFEQLSRKYISSTFCRNF